MKYEFDAKKTTDRLICWLQKKLENCYAILGVSGGKDSTIVAMLLKLAIGRENIFGIMMPNGAQKDLSDSIEICHTLGIRHTIVNIYGGYSYLTAAIDDGLHDLGFDERLNAEHTDMYTTNTPARIRMTTLYGVAAALAPYIGQFRVINTCNGDEDEVGYSTKFGDSAGDISPLADFTVEEVRAIGKEAAMRLGIYEEFKFFIEKTPDDGMSGKSDEEKLGMSYDDIGNYRRLGTSGNAEVDAKIERMHKANLHKIKPMSKFKYNPKF